MLMPTNYFSELQVIVLHVKKYKRQKNQARLGTSRKMDVIIGIHCVDVVRDCGGVTSWIITPGN